LRGATGPAKRVSMRVIVDQDLCEGNSVCEHHAPEVFKVGDDDKSQVLIERPDESLRAKVELAVKRCPRAAIRIVED
jgi:ferredoxin